MPSNPLDIVRILLVFVGVTISLLLTFLPSGKRKQNRVLALFLFLVSWHMLAILAVDYNFLKGYQYLPLALMFLYAPLLCLHIFLSLGKTIPRNWWLHTVPFITALVFYLFNPSPQPLYFIVFGIQLYTYFIITFKLVINAQTERGIKPNTVVWSKFLLVSFGAIWFTVFIDQIGEGIGIGEITTFSGKASFIGLMVFFVGIIYFAMSQPDLFLNVKVLRSNQEQKGEVVLSSDEKLHLKQLKKLFEEDKIYRQDDLDRTIIANKLKVTPQLLSELVNKTYKMGLPDLINSYRIGEAKQILQTDAKTSIKEIYFDVGFNSRSAFNTAFKKFTDKTPSEFKNNI